jgi:uncharacterized protein (DUF58 family)
MAAGETGVLDAARARMLEVWRAVTPFGRSVLGGGVVAWALAWRFGWEELAVIAAAALLSLLVGVAFLLVGNTNLAVLLHLATPRVVVGDPASTTVQATNQATRRMLPVRLEARVGRGLAHVDVPSLASGASHDELFVIPTTRRSVVPVGPVRSVQGDPLGLVRREHVWTGTEHLYVHPRTVTIPSLTTGWMRDLEGETTNDRSPSDVAFHTLREYVVGDDRRHIHWRTTARQPNGRLMVREFVDTRRAHLGLLLSLRTEDYASSEEFELAVSIVASLGLRALADDQDVTCIVGGRRIPTYYGAHFLDALAGIEVGADDTALPVSVAHGRDALRSVSVAAIVAGSPVEPSMLRTAADRLGATVRAVCVTAHLGEEPGLLAVAGAPQLRVGSLEDLPRMVHQVATP